MPTPGRRGRRDRDRAHDAGRRDALVPRAGDNAFDPGDHLPRPVASTAVLAQAHAAPSPLGRHPSPRRTEACSWPMASSRTLSCRRTGSSRVRRLVRRLRQPLRPGTTPHRGPRWPVIRRRVDKGSQRRARRADRGHGVLPRGARVVRSVAAIPGWSARWQPRQGPAPADRPAGGVVQAVDVPPGLGVVTWSYTPPRFPGRGACRSWRPPSSCSSSSWPPGRPRARRLNGHGVVI